MSQIPDKLIDFKAYNDANDILGVVTVDLPDFEPESEELGGAGIAGTMDTPALGQFKPMQASISFSTLTKGNVSLLAPVVHKLSFYGAIQHHDGGAGKLVSKQCKVYIHGLTKKHGAGKFDSGKKMDTTVDIEISYIKIDIGGEVILEIDKLNHKFIVNGEDHLSEVRDHLGMK